MPYLRRFGSVARCSYTRTLVRWQGATTRTHARRPSLSPDGIPPDGSRRRRAPDRRARGRSPLRTSSTGHGDKAPTVVERLFTRSDSRGGPLRPGPAVHTAALLSAREGPWLSALYRILTSATFVGGSSVQGVPEAGSPRLELHNCCTCNPTTPPTPPTPRGRGVRVSPPPHVSIGGESCLRKKWNRETARALCSLAGAVVRRSHP